jgi:hypothetical protein
MFEKPFLMLKGTGESPRYVKLNAIIMIEPQEDSSVAITLNNGVVLKFSGGEALEIEEFFARKAMLPDGSTVEERLNSNDRSVFRPRNLSV